MAGGGGDDFLIFYIFLLRYTGAVNVQIGLAFYTVYGLQLMYLSYQFVRFAQAGTSPENSLGNLELSI